MGRQTMFDRASNHGGNSVMFGCHSERSRAAAEARNCNHPGRGTPRSGRSRFLAYGLRPPLGMTTNLCFARAPLGMTTSFLLVMMTTGCDRGVQIVRDQFARQSRVTIDSLTTQNAALQRQMVVFERISAEKDTLLREVRDAHILIEAVAEQLRRM